MSLFAPLFTPARLREELSDRAWVRAMLDTEAALAGAGGRGRRDPGGGGGSYIAAACGVGARSIPARLGSDALAAGNPVVPLVSALREAVGGEAAGHVHRGATSQDVLDTAAMLVARRALTLVREEVDGVARACAGLARAHAGTLMAGLYVAPEALPITFGLKAAGWLDADARRARGAAARAARRAARRRRRDARRARRRRAGGRARPGRAARPRHARAAVAQLARARRRAGRGARGERRRDGQGRARPRPACADRGGRGSRGGAGGSSTLPHKQNPIGAVRARACAERVPPLAALLFGAMAAQEHERAAGAWHAEWEPFAQILGLTGGAAAAVRETLEQLEVRPDRMRANLDATAGRLLAERVAVALPLDVRHEVGEATASGGPVPRRAARAAGDRRAPRRRRARRAARSRGPSRRDGRADRARARARRAGARDVTDLRHRVERAADVTAAMEEHL